MKFNWLLFSLFFVHSLFGQNANTENALVFHSPFEASVLNAPFGSATEDHLKLYLATAPQNDEHALNFIKLELKTMFANLEQQKFGKKSATKTVALLRDYLETTLLKKYDPYVSFEQLFKSGTYNDASRAALLSLILEHFQIPFEMRHEGLSVVTIVKMEGKSIPVFDPVDPAMEVRFKSSYSQLLKDLKLLSQEETQMDDEVLFQKFYKNQDGIITPGQLAGNMYYIEALNAYQQKEYVTSMNRLQKAQLLYPMPRNGVIRQACMFQLARRINLKSLAGLTDLFNLYEQYPVVEVKHELVSVFTRIADYHIIQKQDPDGLHPFYRHFANELKSDKDLMTSIDRVYYVKLARYYAVHNNRDSLVKYIDLLYQRWPNEAAVQNALAGFLMESLHRIADYGTGITQLNEFIARYPFLEYKPEVQDRRLYFHSLRVRHFFENQQLEDAISAMTVFENYLSKYGRVDRVELWLTTVYASASTYYFQEADYVKAREMANKALSLMPGSEYFAHRIEVLNQY